MHGQSSRHPELYRLDWSSNAHAWLEARPDYFVSRDAAVAQAESFVEVGMPCVLVTDCVTRELVFEHTPARRRPTDA